MADKVKLVTSRFSPYGYKVEMALIEKAIPYEKQEIDLSNKPDWFKKDAPISKVPLLYVGDKVLFESTVICEYLEEAFPEKPLHSKDPIVKANHRAWIEFSNGILAGTFGMMFAQNQEEFDIKKAETVSKIAFFEKALQFNPYFDGNNFLLIDVCMAAIFKPLIHIDNKFTLEIFDLYKKTAAYAESLVTRGSLRQALPDDYEDLFKSFLERKKSHLLTMSFSL